MASFPRSLRRKVDAMDRQRKAVVAVAVACAAGWVGGYGVAGAGGVPETSALTYSGVLEDASGPLTREVAVQVNLWGTQTPEEGATPLCLKSSARYRPNNGHFSVPLPDTCVQAVKDNSELWIEVLVDGTRISFEKLGAVPYALEAAGASRAVGPLAQQVVPPGAVMAFDLDQCPTGWAELEAARGRTIVGVNADAANKLSTRARGDSFGAEQHTLTTANLPPHAHSGTTETAPLDPPGTDPYRDYNQAGCGQAGAAFAYHWDQNCFSNNWRDHRHPFTTNDGPGASEPFGLVPPSLALLWCKKD